MGKMGPFFKSVTESSFKSKWKKERERLRRDFQAGMSVV